MRRFFLPKLFIFRKDCLSLQNFSGVKWQLTLTIFFLANLFFLGCQSSGVGDPYQPEQIPEGGFRRSEVYIETGSPQCRTRVGMVYCLEGDPRFPVGTPGCQDAASCPSPEDIESCVYCTCRCRTPSGVKAKACACPSGYVCDDVLVLGGDGIRGGYCVKEETQKEPSSN